MSDDTVQVAVRIRPLVPSETEKGCVECLKVVPGEQQIQILNSDKAFTYNYVFSPNADNKTFYNTAVRKMIDNIFKGYNVTILAYGQTGSGKTHSMGTNYIGEESTGIIPSAVNDLFEIMSHKKDWEFTVTVSFMELYKEQLYDLLTDKQRNQAIVDIREDGKKIKIAGITEKIVTNAEDTLNCLMAGSQGRVTGATAMNAQSSRSHAIFTLTIHQQQQNDTNSAITSKFHLVDLAGSERSKKTQATGERFKEGININKGLLALGNVISQLGEGGSVSYIGYRDSKLTRLLQDSLGGNSMTLMIACVSPADYNLDETLNTLRYADRARKIKNKPIINQDPQSAEINRLNKLVQELRLALIDQSTGISCPSEHKELIEKNQSLQKKIRNLTEKLNRNYNEIAFMHERAEIAEQAREQIKSDMLIILQEFDDLIRLTDSETNNDNQVWDKIKSIHNKIKELQNNEKKSSEQLRNYEYSLSFEKADLSNSENIDNDIDIINEEHTLLQAERNDQVQDINRELAEKQELVSRLLIESSQAIEYSKELHEMEQEVKTLQSEKEELLKTLHNVQSNNASSKLAESRRKRVQELEKKITELTQKCTEQSKVIKVKEKSDQQIKNLTNEIQNLKQTRVKLIRQMRIEAEKFTKWKHLREKELAKLKEQDYKRQNQMAKMQSQHMKQQNVYKRKMEEFSAVNKRLKEALEVQKKAIQRREKTTSSKDDIQSWVKREVEVLVSTVDAECSLEKLMQERTDLTHQLNDLKNTNPADPTINEIQDFLDIRNAQIADLQQKIVEADQVNRANTRWQIIHTMSDAKAALKFLIDLTAEERKKCFTKNFHMQELLEKYDSIKTQLENNMRTHTVKQETTFLVNHSDSKDVLAELKTNNAQLASELEIYKTRCAEYEAEKNRKKQKKFNPYVPIIDENLLTASPGLLSDDSVAMDDDVENDPDWQKTPLYRRIKKLSDTIRNNVDRPSKRNSDGEVSCNCKTKCATRMCSCRKNGNACTNCNCNPDVCENKDTESISRTLFYDDSNENVVLKKARLTE